MQQALNLVWSEMGPEATVLHTRELNSGLVGRLLRGRQYEIAASLDVQTPTRFPQTVTYESVSNSAIADHRARYRENFHDNSAFRQDQAPQLEDLHGLAEQIRQGNCHIAESPLPESLFQVYTDLIESDIEEELAQQLIEKIRNLPQLAETTPASCRAKIARMLEDDLAVTGPIQTASGQGRIVALVGPTGVGKTTTIAKLAANYRLRENKRVGLITVDTYRIAAVEQLRTYADIIDLPMEVVSTPREMREAVARMRDLDLVLMDTAGRSPRDEVKIQELKSLLAESNPDEVHLVLSAVSGARSLASTAECFAGVGTTALIVTKIDEATVLGNLLSVVRSCRLPISYLTDGQNVPDDIQVANSPELAQMILRTS